KAPDAGSPVDPPSICDAVIGNLVVNCGFETGDTTGWTLTGNAGFIGVTGGAQNSGIFTLFAGPVGSDGFLTQTIPTVPGQAYRISFYFEADGGTPSDFAVSFNGVQLYSEVNPAAHGYELHTVTGVATGASTVLSFQFRDDPGF